MPIQLDWDFESEELADGPLPRWVVSEEGRVDRRWRLILPALAMLLVSGALIAGRLRLHQVDGARRQALEDTIAAETLALRFGDRAAFMMAQAHIERWLGAQAITFERYQTSGVPIVATGEIISLEVDGDLAQVVLRELVDGEPYQVVWFYEYGSDGWRHVPSRVAYWGELQTYQSRYYDIGYVPADQAYAAQVAAGLDAQVERLCELLVCSRNVPRQEMQIETNALAFEHLTSLTGRPQIIPSPGLQRVPDAGELTFTEAQAAVIVVAHRSWFLAPDAYDSGLYYFDPELDRWIVHRLVPDAPPSPLFTYFEAVYGPDFVPDMMRPVQLGVPARDAIRYLLDESLMVSAGSSSLADEFEVLMNFEWGLRNLGYLRQATYLFGDPVRDRGSAMIEMESAVNAASTNAIQVQVVEEVGELVWAQTSFPVHEEGRSVDLRRSTLQPFRQFHGQWYRAEPRLGDWGEERVLEGRHVSLYYRSFDQPFAEKTLERLEQIYLTAAEDFQLGDPERLLPIEFELSPISDRWGLQVAARQIGGGMHLVLPSPALIYYSPGSGDSTFKHPVLTGFIAELLSNSLYFRDLGYIENAMVRYEAQRLDLWVDDSSHWLLLQDAGPDADIPLLPLDALTDPMRPSGTQYAVLSMEADRLIKVLVRDFGDDIAPVLVRHLRNSHDIYSWLADVFADLDEQGKWPYPTSDYYGVIAQIEGEVLSLTGRDLAALLDVETP